MKKYFLLILLIGISNIACSTASKRVSSSVQLNYVQPITQEIRFRFDSERILPKYVPILEKGLAYLNENPESVIIIEGHTDIIGKDKYNLDLGDKRARSIKAYFIEKGIYSERIVIVSYGEAKTKYKSTRLNRRVVFRDAITDAEDPLLSSNILSPHHSEEE